MSSATQLELIAANQINEISLGEINGGKTFPKTVMLNKEWLIFLLYFLFVM